MGRDRKRAALGFRFSDGRASAPRGNDLYFSARLGRIPGAARRSAQGLALARRRRVVGAARQGASRSERIFRRAPRRVLGGRARSRWPLLWHAGRPALRIERRRRELARDSGVPAADPVCQDGDGGLTMRVHIPSALRRWTGGREVIELTLAAETRTTVAG